MGLLALFVFAQILAFVHLVTVPHRACPVHDEEVVHGAEVHGHVLESARSDEGPRDEAGQRWAAPAGHGHEEHCGFVVLLRGGSNAVVGGEPALRMGPEPVHVAGPTARSAPSRGFPLYLLAPKTSPPAFGCA